MKCHHCHRPYTAEEIEAKKRNRSTLARDGLAEAKARGKHIGRPLHEKRDEIAALYGKMSVRKAASAVGVSASTVQSIWKKALKAGGGCDR